MSIEGNDIVETTTTENTGAEVETEQVEWVPESGEPETKEGEQPEVVEGEEPKEEPKPKNRAKERIEQLARENAELRQFKLEQESRQNAPPPSQAPKIEDFEDYSDYQQAQQEWFIEQAESRVLAKLKQENDQKGVAERSSSYESAAIELQDDGIDVQGLFQKAESLPPLPVQLDQFGLNAKDTLSPAADIIGDDDLYYELSGMSAVQAAAKIGQLIGAKQNKQVSAPKVTKAPPPLKTVKASAAIARNPETMSDAEWYKNEIQSRKGK